MKKTIIVGSIAALSLLGASAAHAQDASVTGSANAQAGFGDNSANVEMRGDARFSGPESGDQERPEGEREHRSFATSTRERDDNGIDENQENPSTTTRPAFKDRRDELKAEIETRKMELEQRRASTTMEVKIKRIGEIAKMVENRFSEELSRLSTIKGKIDTRLDKFDQAGASTTAARADLSIAVTAMGVAQVKVSALASLDVATSTPQAAAGIIRQAAQDAQKAIIDAQKALMTVVSDMKGLEASVQESESASTTESNQ